MNNNKTSNPKSKIFSLIAIFLIVLFVGIQATKNIGQSESERNTEKALKSLSQDLKSINYSTGTPVKSTVNLGSTNLSNELPEITQYPLSVEGKGDINIEIFSSPEKAGSNTDGWLNEVATKFNNSNYKIGDKTVSVSIRSVASGTAIDYISSKKYLPDAFTPSNELWGDLGKAQGANISKIDDALVKNTAGIII